MKKIGFFFIVILLAMDFNAQTTEAEEVLILINLFLQPLLHN